jgi:ABC-type transporter Mla subunit MlaD
MSPREGQSAAAAAAERVRAVLEAAEQSAAELRAEAAEEIDGQLARAHAVAERLSTRADEIERSLQALGETVRQELSSLKADLEELRAVGEGIGAAREEAAAAPREARAPEKTAPEAEAPVPKAVELPAGQEGARVIALNMALNGSTREETARYLSENFELDEPEALLDEVYSRL